MDIKIKQKKLIEALFDAYGSSKLSRDYGLSTRQLIYNWALRGIPLREVYRLAVFLKCSPYALSFADLKYQLNEKYDEPITWKQAVESCELLPKHIKRKLI